jgi:hypothetical protein
MGHAVGGHGVFQGLDDVFLGDNFVPEERAPFTVEGLGHGIFDLGFAIFD